MPDSWKFHPKSIQNRPKWCPGTVRKRPWEQAGSRLSKKAPRLFIKLRFWAPLGRFWASFGASWAPRGSQNRPFWYEDAPKCRKMRSRMRHQKKYEFADPRRVLNTRRGEGLPSPPPPFRPGPPPISDASFKRHPPRPLCCLNGTPRQPPKGVLAYLRAWAPMSSW